MLKIVLLSVVAIKTSSQSTLNDARRRRQFLTGRQVQVELVPDDADVDVVVVRDFGVKDCSLLVPDQDLDLVVLERVLDQSAKRMFSGFRLFVGNIINLSPL